MSDAGGLLVIRTFEAGDEPQVVELWQRCGLVTPWNDPHQDIKAKTDFQPDLFFVGEIGGKIEAVVMAGYDGHRGWINYLGVSPDRRRQNLGRLIMEHAEARLKELGCPKINLQVRASNKDVIAFYQSLGFAEEDVINMGKRLDR